MTDTRPRPPTRLRQLLSWQASRVGVLGARFTAQEMGLASRVEYAVLATVEEFGPLSQADLGRNLGLDRNDVSTAVGRLDKDSLLDRRPDPADPRRNQIRLTRAGHRKLAQLQKAADRVQVALLTGLTEREQHQLISLLDKVLAQHPPLAV